jgi:hypothetical protein
VKAQDEDLHDRVYLGRPRPRWPQIEAKTRAEAELICEGLGRQIVRELTNVVVANRGMDTPH